MKVGTIFRVAKSFDGKTCFYLLLLERQEDGFWVCYHTDVKRRLLYNEKWLGEIPIKVFNPEDALEAPER